MEGYCYAVVFSNGRCKFGKSRVVDNRLSKHRASADAHGVEVSRIAVSCLLRDMDDVEEELLRVACTRFELLSGKEMFGGGDEGTYIECLKDAVEKKEGGWCVTCSAIEYREGIGMCAITDLGGASPAQWAKRSGAHESGSDRIRENILRLLKKHGKYGVTSGILANRMRYAAKDELIRIADIMCEDGLIKKAEIKPVRGRPSVRYYINPR